MSIHEIPHVSDVQVGHMLKKIKKKHRHDEKGTLALLSRRLSSTILTKQQKKGCFRKIWYNRKRDAIP